MDNTTWASKPSNGGSAEFIRLATRSETQRAASRALKALQKSQPRVVSIKQPEPVSKPVQINNSFRTSTEARQQTLNAIERRIKAARISLRVLTDALDEITGRHAMEESVIKSEPAAQPHVVLRCVSEYTGISKHAILSDRRDGPVHRARHIVYFLSEEMTRRSFASLGRHFTCDHTSIIFGTKKIRRAIEEEPDMLATLDAIRDLIRRQP